LKQALYLERKKERGRERESFGKANSWLARERFALERIFQFYTDNCVNDASQNEIRIELVCGFFDSIKTGVQS